MDWLRERLCDRRLETALSMLQRFGIIEDENDLANVDVAAPLPEALANDENRQEKRIRDQKKLYALVEYVKSPDRKHFIDRYFGMSE
jgi:ATP-dependent DNA helicase RecQ